MEAYELICEKSGEALLQRQQRFSEFMDANPQVFQASSEGKPWVDVVGKYKTYSEADQLIIDKALGMVVSILKSAHLASHNGFDLEDLMSAENCPEMEAVQPDPAALSMTQTEGENNSASVAFGRSVTLFKDLIRNGLVSKDQLLSQSIGILDNLPGSSALHQSLVETAKQLVTIDMDMLFADAN